MPDIQREALEMIASKLARILNGDNNYADSYHDIGGYSKLVEDDLTPQVLPQPEMAKASVYVTSGPAYQGSGSMSAESPRAVVADVIPAVVLAGPIIPSSPTLPGGPIARAE